VLLSLYKGSAEETQGKKIVMIDPRFFPKKNSIALAEIVAATGVNVSETIPLTLNLSNVAPIAHAGPTDVTFLSNRKYVQHLATTQAGACFVEADLAHALPESTVALVTDQPYLAFAKTAGLLYPAPPYPQESFQHPSAVVAEGVVIGKACRIGPQVIIEKGAHIGDHTVIMGQAYIGEGVKLGSFCWLFPQVTVTHALVGDHVVLHSGARIGQAGFGFAPSFDHGVGPTKIPQLGRVILEDHVDIGANTCIDRGSGPDTVIGRGTMIDNLVQIGHNVTIGENSIIVSQVGISGSTAVGHHVHIGGQVGIVGHITIGHHAKIAAGSGVMRKVPDHQSVGGRPAMPMREFLKQIAYLKKVVGREKG
jgi:UDP-3-O-[3-hydroxymyristoyl] glucosamine N-acyltransferase